ncbi:cationic amino acid transporter 2-like isoform X1 [Tribolium madens]|uniref:cationic amino acid transporter 2-like isoform X1 n=2 Tax=Tribolium madens TaxID=41895 RepID=UPI001CF73A87|nr:cationic amino acid transporter 2-like isoform X1 [Tribolium madens]
MEIAECLILMKMGLRTVTFGKVADTLSRKKVVEFETGTKLAKVLTTLDLTALGVGSTLGVGIYVLAGDVAKNNAGPAVTVSFFIAAVTSILAGLCYAEFGARVPKAGSAYVYSYVCIGELFAFIIGWNLILEYLIGSATVVKALFLYLDELSNNVMSQFFQENIPIEAGGELGQYADIFSLGLSLLFAVAIALGAKESSLVNNIFTLVNLLVVLTVIISGLWKAKASNWSIPPEEVPPDSGNGGFAPFGIKGVIQGAARCFFAFIGFDCIATAGEEAKTPHKSIPISVVTSLLIVFFSYFGISTILTMMLPYFEQHEKAPLTHIYDVVGWPALKYVVSVGAICGLFSSLLGAMFPLPRIIYAMASDGLLFKALAIVHPKFQTPFMGTLLAGSIAGCLACIFDVDKLANMMSIGTLLAYSMVAACVLILRYAVDESEKKFEDKEELTGKMYFKQLFNRKSQFPTRLTSSLVSWLVLAFFSVSFIFSGLITGFEKDLENAEPWLISILCILAVVLVIVLFIVSWQPKSSVQLTFSVPLVPWIPGVSILVNVYLMTTLPAHTWEYYAYWMLIGFVIYFTYGIWNSTERKIRKTPETKNEPSADDIKENHT